MGLAEAHRANREYELAVASARKAIDLDPTPENQEKLGQYEQLLRQGFVGRVRGLEK
jgi:hypothetical protein